MYDFMVGDIVTRRSYGGDVPFTIIDIINRENEKPIYVLKGLMFRIQADSDGEDLVKQSPDHVYRNMYRYFTQIRKQVYRKRFAERRFFAYEKRGRPGKILHIDSSRDFMDTCLKHYNDAGITSVGRLASEREQPGIVRRLLEQIKPDILVVTGHDSIKKGADMYSLDSYANSRYYIQSVKEARKYESSNNRLCIFAGACQSYYESIMEAGANFASSPGRVFINALDPAFVSEKIALTDSRRIVTPQEIAQITISGSKGIGGINTRGHLAEA